DRKRQENRNFLASARESDGNCRKPKISGLSERKRQIPCLLAGSVAGRASPDLENG
ncbi:hypothetical protein A2U01_0077835, partial [Trifolium medium]|nr:hypothetical protein [Trifolium medium]